MKQKFITAVNAGDVVSVRLMLSNELMLDPRGKSFDEMLFFAEKQLPNHYEADNQKYYDIPSDKWNEEFLFSLKNDLDENFSKDKVHLYKKVAMVVLKDKAENLYQEEVKKGNDISIKLTSSANSKHEESSNKTAKTVIVGGAALTIAGLCLSKVALTSIGILGVMGGIVLYNKSK